MRMFIQIKMGFYTEESASGVGTYVYLRQPEPISLKRTFTYPYRASVLSKSYDWESYERSHIKSLVIGFFRHGQRSHLKFSVWPADVTVT